MRTWLDQYTESRGRDMRRHWKTDPRTRDLAVPSDFELMSGLVYEGLLAALGTAGDRQLDRLEGGFWASLSPFFLEPDEEWNLPYACALRRDLAQLFGGADVTPEVKRHGEEFAKRKTAVYIDVADRAFRLGEKHHLKAIVLLRIPSGARHLVPALRSGDDECCDYSIRFFTIIGEVGRIAETRMSWSAGTRTFQCDDSLRRTISDLLDRSGKGLEDVARDIENLAWLTLAYASVAEPAARRLLPMADPALRAGVDRRARRQIRQFTLFRVERLQPPPNNFSRTNAGGADGWQLERRTVVRGHYKMQPHGPNGTLRKLIFVGRHYRGPIDAPPVHSMVALRR